MTTETTPRIYVGTYAKYNSGSIAGKWLGGDMTFVRHDGDLWAFHNV